ncbi:hypothetical protein BVRB_8g195280 [Beta vulgaris subsp. vulgaris]|uniref:EG45-like domain containing protein n=1 Tax=Beta vulgaris subsp. vulgaris TaxID=3555 RepID=UPI00053F90AD|nr:EG45-like domain containing protein [Beta vulgaris subsp. vulgaris]KMT02958.1 hypothetical protein BVRB_8g195280 [Beta vulgaris subsp. vulgaris]
MSRLELFCIFINILSVDIFHTCSGDVGAAAPYSSPYIPTECYSGDATEFPSNNLFAAAGDGIWNNGAACGRQYLVRCISAPEPLSCAMTDAIQVKIVDYANSAVSQPVVTPGTTMLLSNNAYDMLVNSSSSTSLSDTSIINIEFQQV